LDRADKTTAIQGWIDHLHAGDNSTRTCLLEHAAGRMEILGRLMLRSDPGGARRKATDDIARDTLARLDRALRDIAPPSARDFYPPAGAQIRLELIDLARRYDGPEVPDAPCEMTLVYDQGFNQPEAAIVLGVPESSVNRGWIAPQLRLGTALGGQLPV
jgi:hypothetical protein